MCIEKSFNPFPNLLNIWWEFFGEHFSSNTNSTCLLLLPVKLWECFYNLVFAFLLWLASWWFGRSNIFF